MILRCPTFTRTTAHTNSNLWDSVNKQLHALPTKHRSDTHAGPHPKWKPWPCTYIWVFGLKWARSRHENSGHLVQAWWVHHVSLPGSTSSANVSPVRVWGRYRPSGGHALFTIGEMKPFHFHLGGLQRKMSEREYHLCIHKSLFTSYQHLSQIFALLPIMPIKRRNIFQVKKVRLVSEIICLY